MIISSTSNQMINGATPNSNVCYAPGLVKSSKYVPMLTGERPEAYSSNCAAYQLLVQCEQQAEGLQALIHVTHSFYYSPHFIKCLSSELSSLGRVYSQLPNICGILIYDYNHCINICAFNHAASKSQICIYNIYPLFSVDSFRYSSTLTEWAITFERIVGNESQTYWFDNLQIQAESVYQFASMFYLSHLKG